MRGLTEIRNLTPHAITIAMREDNPLELASEGVARVEETFEKGYYFAGGLEVQRVNRGKVVGLPDVRAGVLLVVSRVVLDWFHHNDNVGGDGVTGRGAHDLVAPGKLTRNSEGQIVGCEGLICNTNLDLIEGFLQRDVVITDKHSLVIDEASGLLAVSHSPCAWDNALHKATLILRDLPSGASGRELDQAEQKILALGSEALRIQPIGVYPRKRADHLGRWPAEDPDPVQAEAPAQAE